MRVIIASVYFGLGPRHALVFPILWISAHGSNERRGLTDAVPSWRKVFREFEVFFLYICCSEERALGSPACWGRCGLAPFLPILAQFAVGSAQGAGSGICPTAPAVLLGCAINHFGFSYWHHDTEFPSQMFQDVMRKATGSR